MTNRELAATLFNIATLLRDRQDNPYRIRAYERSARALMARRDPLAPALAGLPEDAKKALPHRKWVLGDRVQFKLAELARTGRMDYFDGLCADLPPHVGALMAVPGVGPRLADRLHAALGVETADDLARAARSGRTQSVWGVGEKRRQQWAQPSLFDGSDDIELFPTPAPGRKLAA